MSDQTNWVRAVITVGEGRGFIVETPRSDRVIITAGHCLPRLPPSLRQSFVTERTFNGLLGPLGEEPTVWAECLFVDPVADLAILGAPDSQALAAENERYDKLVEARPALRIANLPLVSERCRIGSTEFRMPPLWTGPAYLLSRDGRIFGCTVLALHQGLVIEASDEPVEGGMSGSPIVSEHGAAVGIVSSSADDGREGEGAFLYWSVPGWMLAALAGK